ncbi:MAG TPA: PfkB family carbohydrate kinase [Mycobacteriales bacterium]|nr:PfkB family carbohydrate kinase [Mycobacteriales bacterium]
MSIACTGDNVIDIYLGSGQGYPGGNAVNVAVAACRSGEPSAYVGAVGQDDFGAILRQSLASEGVATDHLRVLAGTTAWCEVRVVDGDREFLNADEGVSRITLSDSDLDYLAGFSVVHTGDNSMLESQVAAIAARAKVSFDFGERPRGYVDELIGHVWCACFSASRLSADAATALADEMAALGPAVVLVSEGSRGAQLVVDGARYRSASHAAAVTDSLGAGDALIGGVLAGLVSGQPPQDALTAGMQLAARTVSDYGAFGYGFDLDASAVRPVSIPRPHDHHEARRQG